MEKRIPSLDQFINESKLNEGKNIKVKVLGSIGQFSWITQDSGMQIGCERENRIPV